MSHVDDFREELVRSDVLAKGQRVGVPKQSFDIAIMLTGQHHAEQLGFVPLQLPNRRKRTMFEEQLDYRLVRLWDNFEAFMACSTSESGIFAFTGLFGRTFTQLFRDSKFLAEQGVRL